MSERQKKQLAQKEANKAKRRMIEKVLSNSKGSSAALELNYLVDGWLELDSDPGTFSLLIEDFGCFGAQVEEIYDLDQKFDGPVFGFIFLFKWLNNQQQNDRLRNHHHHQPTSKYASSSSSTNNGNNNNGNSCNSTSTTNNQVSNNLNENGQATTDKATSTTNDNKEQQDLSSDNEQEQWSYVEDENIISDMFFAKQMISNSCATHALISILLNCDYDGLHLGPTLTRLKEHTKIMDPESKGYAIGNLPEIAKAHNSHASFSSLYNIEKPSPYTALSFMVSGNQRTSLQQQKNHEAYHFVSYVPIKNRLYELDGLKHYPIDHGPIGPSEDWTEKFKNIIKQRLSGNKTGDDIRYNLMAVVPDKRVSLRSQLKRLKFFERSVDQKVQSLTKRKTTPVKSNSIDVPKPPYSPLSTGTLTASEAGSACSSPDYTFEDDIAPESLFLVKFGTSAESNSLKEENSEPAHKNCIVQVESTPIDPLNMTKVALEKAVSPAKSQVSTRRASKDAAKIEKLVTDEVGEEKPTDDTDKKEEKDEDLKKKLQDEEVTEKDRDGVNIIQAHKDEKYNLSAEPPFDFNILDEMQHVHIGKSALQDLYTISSKLTADIDKIESALKEENDKRRKYRIDNSRRTHNYEPFIMTFLSMLAKQGNLADLIERDMPNSAANAKAVAPPTPATPTNKIQKPPASSTKLSNGTTTPGVKPEKKYKYVSTGRPVGRPRKNPLPTPQ